jgi:hypothetical protein
VLETLFGKTSADLKRIPQSGKTHYG